MEPEKIKELFTRYYEGLTSEEEEAVLKDYLDKTRVSEKPDPSGAILSLKGDKIPEPSEEFSRRLLSIGSSKTGSKRHLEISRFALSVAAGLALLIATYALFTDKRSGEMKDTFSDPELAMAEVRSVLCTVSRNMKSGTEPLKAFNTMSVAEKSLNELGKINSSVDKSLGKLRYLNILETTTQQQENK